MHVNNPVELWRSSSRARPMRRESFRRMHLSVLKQATQEQLQEQLYYIYYKQEDLTLCELKGQASDLLRLPLPQQEEETLWLALQFQGKIQFSNGGSSSADSLYMLQLRGEDEQPTLAAGKQWLLLLGIQGAAKRQLLAELPELRENLTSSRSAATSDPVNISHNDRQLLEQFSKANFGPFSASLSIGLLYSKLFAAYSIQLNKALQRAARDSAQIQLYHRAVAYIMKHYEDPDLNTETLASICGCSSRHLARSFAEHNSSVKSSILLIRLHKGRELLRQQPELSVEQIALNLHFFDARHFIRQYRSIFHRTPSEERKSLEKRR